MGPGSPGGRARDRLRQPGSEPLQLDGDLDERLGWELVEGRRLDRALARRTGERRPLPCHRRRAIRAAAPGRAEPPGLGRHRTGTRVRVPRRARRGAALRRLAGLRIGELGARRLRRSARRHHARLPRRRRQHLDALRRPDRRPGLPDRPAVDPGRPTDQRRPRHSRDQRELRGLRLPRLAAVDAVGPTDRAQHRTGGLLRDPLPVTRRPRGGDDLVGVRSHAEGQRVGGHRSRLVQHGLPDGSAREGRAVRQRSVVHRPARPGHVAQHRRLPPAVRLGARAVVGRRRRGGARQVLRAARRVHRSDDGHADDDDPGDDHDPATTTTQPTTTLATTTTAAATTTTAAAATTLATTTTAATTTTGAATTSAAARPRPRRPPAARRRPPRRR